MTMPEWVGRSEGYVTLATFCVAMATGLLGIHLIDGTQWVQAVLGVMGIVCAGGAAAAYRK